MQLVTGDLSERLLRLVTARSYHLPGGGSEWDLHYRSEMLREIAELGLHGLSLSSNSFRTPLERE